MTKTSTLDIEFLSPILWCTLKNEAYGNSFGVPEARKINAALDRWKDDASTLIFRSASRNIFCGGGNLKKYASMTREEGVAANAEIRSVLDRLARWEVPTLALVNGTCWGGGMEVLSAFDMIFATPRSLFGFWQRRVGLTYGWGGGARWLDRLPRHQLFQLTLEARTLSPVEALRLGLVDRLFPECFLEERAAQWAESEAQWPIEPRAALRSFDAHNEQEIFEDLWETGSHRRILDKFR